jgi:hypothetical protein
LLTIFVLFKINNMDCRITLKRGESFFDQLQILFRSGTEVSLLLDEGGIDRAGGLIKSIQTNDEEPWMELESGVKIKLKTIIAVNGIFLTDYGEC